MKISGKAKKNITTPKGGGFLSYIKDLYESTDTASQPISPHISGFHHAGAFRLQLNETSGKQTQQGSI